MTKHSGMDSERHRTTEREESLDSSPLCTNGSRISGRARPGILTQHPEFTRSNQRDMVSYSLYWIYFFLPLKLHDQNHPQRKSFILEFVMLRLIRTHIAMYPREKL